METLDYESWRCKHDDKIFCPPEGCPKSYGCARDHGWKPGDPTPNGCLGIADIQALSRPISEIENG